MQVTDDVPRSAGVFALLHTSTAEAYVNETNDLRQRALLWKQVLESKTKRVPAKNFPKYPAEEWTFWVCPHADYAKARAELEGSGWKLLNDYRPRKTYTVVYEGTEFTGSLSDLCQRAGVKLHTAYKRMDRGMTVEQALGIAGMNGTPGGAPLPDKRELSIAMMAVQIVNENGGLLTYDEAVMLRPELGNVRDKMKRWRAKHPGQTQVALQDL